MHTKQTCQSYTDRCKNTQMRHKALESIGKRGDHNAHVQRWLEFLTSFDYTLKYRSANGNSDASSRLPEPVTEHDRGGYSSLTPVEDGGIFLTRTCGLRTRSSPTPGVGLSGLVRRPESAVLGGLPFTSSDFRGFRAHKPRMRIDDLSALWGDSSLVYLLPSLTSIPVLAWGIFHSPPHPRSPQFVSYPQEPTRALQKPPH